MLLFRQRQLLQLPEELNILDGATVVVGEINALDLGSTGVGTAIASKAVILDSNKDYTGIRNLTITGAGSTAALTASGILKTDDTTAATSTTDGSLQTDGGLSVAGDAVIGDDLFMLSDAAQVTFGADKDVTLTHVADTGLLVNAAMVVQFRDSAINIGSPADGDLDINADDEIELNSTLIDVNGNLDVSGTVVAASSITAGSLDISGDIDVDGTANLDQVDIDGGVNIAANVLVTVSNAIQFRDNNLTIKSTTDGQLDIGADTEIELTAATIDVVGNFTNSGTIVSAGIIKTDDTTAATSTTDGSLQTDGGLSVALDAVIGDDIIMLSDGAVMHFGTNSEVTLTHVHNVGLTITHTGTGDNLPVVLQLKSEEDAIVANEVIASIEFAAGDSDGTDGATVAAGIHAIAEDTFSASANATKLVFTTGVSETAASSATAKMTLSSAGLLTIADDLVIKSGGTIGGAGDTDLLTLGSGILTVAGTVNMTTLAVGGTNVTSTAAELNILDGVTATAAEINLIDGGTARGTTAVADGDGILINDAGTMRMTTVQTVSAYMAAESVGGGNIVTTGALNSGTITSGFGTINNGSSTITTTGTVATGAITAGGDITRGGSVYKDGSITDTGTFTVDVAGDIILDADGTAVMFKDAGTEFGRIFNSSTNLVIKSIVSDKDMIFQGNDGGSAITALTLDMSAAGAATFNNNVTAFSDERLKSNIRTVPDALAKVTAMRGVHYTRDDTDRDHTGVVAQGNTKNST